MATTLGINCPFCKEKLRMDQYKMREGGMPQVTIYCDNDQCKVEPCTDHTNPSAAFADVAAWR